MHPILRQIRRLGASRSGNAALIVALGMPALIGGAGLAVDTAQWYMWKRELQFAVDQAAIAGAWAQSDTATQSTYQDRARQEYASNIAVTKDFATKSSALSVTRANYAGGVNNSVIVSASASKSLPFSGFLTGEPATVSVFAQASFQEGKTYTSCLIATDDDASGAITIGGNSVLTASCGLAALSTSDTSIVVNGQPTIDAGWILSAGGIDDWFKTNTDDTILEHLDGLYDPYKNLTPPAPTESLTARTYTCIKGTKTTRANVTTDVETTYSYYKGLSPDANNDGVLTSAELSAATWSVDTSAKGKSKQTSSSTALYTLVENETVDGVTTTTTRKVTKTNNASGTSASWEVATTVTKRTQSGTVSTTTPDQATVQPGTYTDMQIGCTTVFAPGVYIINGGGLKIPGQYQVTGSGVMFVLKNSAYVDINGGSNVNLTAMTAAQLIAKGVSADQANKLAGMLIFEDRTSPGTSRNKINGNANTILNGTVYLPQSGIEFSGTAGVSSQCLMIAASTITLTGTTNMTTFCPSGMTNSTTVVNTKASVKLVA
jgi:Flp pilus assembly protein TadG